MIKNEFKDIIIKNFEYLLRNMKNNISVTINIFILI